MLTQATTSKATALHPRDLQRHPTGTAGHAPIEATNDGEAQDYADRPDCDNGTPQGQTIGD